MPPKKVPRKPSKQNELIAPKSFLENQFGECTNDNQRNNLNVLAKNFAHLAPVDVEGKRRLGDLAPLVDRQGGPTPAARRFITKRGKTSHFATMLRRLSEADGNGLKPEQGKALVKLLQAVRMVDHDESGRRSPSASMIQAPEGRGEEAEAEMLVWGLEASRREQDAARRREVDAWASSAGAGPSTGPTGYDVSAVSSGSENSVIQAVVPGSGSGAAKRTVLKAELGEHPPLPNPGIRTGTVDSSRRVELVLPSEPLRGVSTLSMSPDAKPASPGDNPHLTTDIAVNPFLYSAYTTARQNIDERSAFTTIHSSFSEFPLALAAASSSVVGQSDNISLENGSDQFDVSALEVSTFSDFNDLNVTEFDAVPAQGSQRECTQPQAASGILGRLYLDAGTQGNPVFLPDGWTNGYDVDVPIPEDISTQASLGEGRQYVRAWQQEDGNITFPSHAQTQSDDVFLLSGASALGYSLRGQERGSGAGRS